MRYYSAPMEGFTDAIWRDTHAHYFGGAGFGPDDYYAPFLSPKADLDIDPRQLKDVLPETCAVRPVPQILGKDVEAFVWMAGKLKALGYESVNLNVGCPSGTVTAKDKGAGLLRKPDLLEAYLDGIFEKSPLPISVKTRLGFERAAEFPAILEIYNRYPITELTIHPRVAKQFYAGPVDMAMFDWAVANSKAPVCYNGSLYTVREICAFEAAHPAVDAVMLGRGLLADPALVRKLKGGAALDKAELRAFLDELYSRYTERFGSRSSAMRRMKGVWGCVLCLFADHDKLEKQLRKLRDPAEYNAVVDAIFARLPLLDEAVDVT